MQKVSFVFQILFKVFLIYLIVFVWIRFFVKSLVYSILISAILTATIDFLTRCFFNRKHKKFENKLKEKEEAENIFLSLVTNKTDMSFFDKLTKQESVKHKDYITYTSNDCKRVIYPKFSLNPLSISDIAEIMKKIKKEKANKVIILSGEITKECYNFINIFDEKVILLNKYDTYEKIYKAQNIYPKITIQTKKSKKLTFKELLAYSFNKERCKGYIFSAITLLFCSLFVQSTLYYAVATSLLLVFALISYINPFYNKPLPKDIL